MQSVISVAITDLAQTTAGENISHMLHVMSSYLQHLLPLTVGALLVCLHSICLSLEDVEGVVQV